MTQLPIQQDRCYHPSLLLQANARTSLSNPCMYYAQERPLLIPTLPLPLKLPPPHHHYPHSSTTSATTISSSSHSINDFFLPQKLGGDLLCAATVTAVAAPFLTIIDKALVERAAGSKSVIGSAQESLTFMVRHPIHYLKSPTFLWMWATYAATYSAANSLQTLTEYRQVVRNQSTSCTAVFLGTTATNSTASMLKDRAYARLFGNQHPVLSSNHAVVPKLSYAVWVARDFTVIGSSFILPDRVAPLLQTTLGCTSSTAAQVAQVATPMVAQVVAGPLHVLGLDFYNRPGIALRDAGGWKRTAVMQSIMDRSRFVSSCFREVVAARIVRIVPGYGIAGIWNKSLRTKWREQLQENSFDPSTGRTTTDAARNTVSTRATH